MRDYLHLIIFLFSQMVGLGAMVTLLFVGTMTISSSRGVGFAAFGLVFLLGFADLPLAFLARDYFKEKFPAFSAMIDKGIRRLVQGGLLGKPLGKRLIESFAQGGGKRVTDLLKRAIAAIIRLKPVEALFSILEQGLETGPGKVLVDKIDRREGRK